MGVEVREVERRRRRCSGPTLIAALSLLFALVSGLGVEGSSPVAEAASAETRGSCSRIFVNRTEFKTRKTAVFSLTPRGTQVRRLTPWHGRIIATAVSPDGAFIIGSNHDRDTGQVSLVKASTRTGRWRRLTHDSASYGGVEISPNSRFLAFSRYDDQVNRSGLSVMDLRTKEHTSIMQDAHFATWAPSGRKLIFSRETGSLLDVNHELFTIRRDGSELTQLTYTTEAGESGAVYRPDGRRILFERYPHGQMNENDGPYADIWSMKADGTDARQLTSQQDDYNGVQDPQWSPNGERISFDFVNDAFMAALTARADGSRARRVTDRGEYSGGPIFSPNSRKVVVWVQTAEGTDVLIARADGSNERWLLRTQRYSDRPIAWRSC